MGLPDEGTYDWLDFFKNTNPGYAEVSDRAVEKWALRSELWKPDNVQGPRCRDKPIMNFGIGPLDNGIVKDTLAASTSVQSRNVIMMGVRGNLLKEDRMAALKRFRLPHCRKVARIMMGEPDAAFKAEILKTLLALKQTKSDQAFKVKKEELKKQREIDAKQRLLEKARKKTEKLQKKQAAALQKKADEEASKAKAEEEKKVAAEKAAAEKAAEENGEKKEGEEAEKADAAEKKT